jgi:glycosyltransferase involved in cell wall biosynthesis
MAYPRLVQVGDWLRKLRSIYEVRAEYHERIILQKKYTSDFLEREAEIFGPVQRSGVKELEYVSDEEYDSLLSSSVVLCLLYETAANNAVIECIARGTPIIISPLAAAVEYLGQDYPLYASSIDEVDALLSQPSRIRRASQYLQRRRQQIDLSYDAFFKDVANSTLYKRL